MVDVLKFPVHIPFVEQLGFELHGVSHGEAELRVNLGDAHMNSFDVAHGGVIMTLLDVAMAHAARSVNRAGDDFGPGVVTIEMKTSFMRPGEGRLVATGRLLERTTTMAFCEGSVHNEAGQLCAHATGSFKFLKALPTGRTLKPLRGPASD
ncbi:MAG: PaaI family thioesterase [Paucibacter sp.]|nr:PaaI family thioesterase [Roseateles sp.]